MLPKAPMSDNDQVRLVDPFTERVVPPIVMLRAVPQVSVVIFALPLNDVPLMVLAVVNVAADATALVESAVLLTFPNPTSAAVNVTAPVRPATEVTLLTCAPACIPSNLVRSAALNGWV